MYLKSLEVSNFKSFKGEVTIPLDRGFTAITGPNGSGKSNCGDAIQFVLGPKSNKVIRAQNSADLIFNGGKNSKPARECSVTLIFANPQMSNGRRRLPLEKDEIRMSRKVRLTASNNVVTTYALNDEESNQKAFHRLLGAANARPDGYNIVLQGDVTSLAKMTANERRKVLDGVAGVTSYDDEIRKASKQQEKVETFIERIGLLEKEMVDRLTVLEKEKALAVKAKDVTEELSQTNQLLLQSRYASLKHELEFHSAQREKYLGESQQLMDDHQEGEKALLQLDDRIAELQREINALTGGDSSELGKAIQALQVSIELNNDRIADAEREDEEASIGLETLNQEWTDAHEEYTAFVEGLKTAKDDLVQAMTELKEAQEVEASVRESLETAGEQNLALSQALTATIEALESAKAHLDESQQAVNLLGMEAEMVGKQLETAQEEAEELRLALGECDVRHQQLKEDAPEFDRKNLAASLHQSQRTEQQLSEDTTRIEIKLREAERQLASAKSEMEEKSGARGLAGGASAVIAARDRGELKGIIGTIAELCAPKDARHEVALATAIGGGMASVVVESDEDAARAIQWLAQSKSGRATFLPLNKLANSRPAGKSVMAARKEGVIGFAYELLDYDPRIDIAVRFVLRNTLLVDSMSTARRHMGGIRLITLDGNLIEAGGAMVGGSKRKMNITFGGRIQGATEVERLTGEVDKLRLMSQTVTEALREARRQQQELRMKINALVDDSHTTAMNELKAERKQTQTAYSKSQGVVKGLEETIAGLESDAKQALTALDAAQSAHQMTIEARDQAQTALEDASPEHLKERLHGANIKRVQATGVKERAEETIESGASHESLLLKVVNETKARITRLEGDQIKRSERIDTLSGDIATASIELKAKKDEQAILLEENQGLETERQELTEERATLRVKNDARLTDAQTHRRHAEELMRTIAEREQEVRLMAEELIEADLSPNDLPENLGNVGDLERKIRRLQKQLEEFGNVNIMAIEQFAACQQRLDLMKDEFAALQTRRKELIDVTEQLEAQRKERLVNVLENVNENFKKSYHELSDGGRGELFLENPDEPFKGGLELWAQPRGKSSKVSRQQLSGGEQSMAALALIFAIQDYDPSPFYYFDEVDQNLDAYNAERIAKMCRLRSQRAQFIMVTLRKVSLKLADHHIGITHGGDGCSRRILDFDRDRAIALGQAALKEAQSDAKKNETRLLDAQKVTEGMPRVPEELDVPQSLGGVLPHLSPTQNNESLGGLAERAAELTEDIEERAEVANQLIEEEVASPPAEDELTQDEA